MVRRKDLFLKTLQEVAQQNSVFMTSLYYELILLFTDDDILVLTSGKFKMMKLYLFLQIQNMMLLETGFSVHLHEMLLYYILHRFLILAKDRI